VRSYIKIPLLLILICLIALFFASAIFGLQSLILAGVPDAKPFHFLRILSRSLTVVLFFGMLYYIKKIEKKSFLDFGLRPDKFSKRMLVGGFFLGTVSMLLLIFLQLAQSDSKIEDSNFSDRFYFDLIVQLFVVFTIALVEEWFFRGYVLQSLAQDLGIKYAVYISSLFFAITHFVRPVSNWEILVPELIGLFLIGLILANAYVYSKSIYLSIGIHAGWVYIVKLDKYFVNHFDSQLQKTFGGEKLLKSMAAWVLVILILLILKKFVTLLETKKTKTFLVERGAL
jgi:membrane protease YdiL (CAAX protease family)